MSINQIGPNTGVGSCPYDGCTFVTTATGVKKRFQILEHHIRDAHMRETKVKK